MIKAAGMVAPSMLQAMHVRHAHAHHVPCNSPCRCRAHALLAYNPIHEPTWHQDLALYGCLGVWTSVGEDITVHGAAHTGSDARVTMPCCQDQAAAITRNSKSPPHLKMHTASANSVSGSAHRGTMLRRRTGLGYEAPGTPCSAGNVYETSKRTPSVDDAGADVS